MSAIHFFFAVPLIGGAVALGDAGKTLSRPQEIALAILSFPMFYVTEPLAPFLVSVAGLVGSAAAFLGMIALNSMAWGLAITLGVRWLTVRNRPSN